MSEQFAKLLHVHDRSELQEGALRSNAAAFVVKFLQVLQKSSLLQPLQDDRVVRSQTDSGSVR